MNRRRTVVLGLVGAVVLAGALLVVNAAWARVGERGSVEPLAPADAVPSAISYQGRLLDADGSPVEGTYTMSFRIYGQESGGAPLWSDSFAVPVEGGLFHVALEVDAALFDGRALWLGVEVEGDAEELSPRQPLLPAPYAFSLRPGATISGTVTGMPILEIVSGGGIGLRVNKLATGPGDAALVGVNHGEGPGGVFSSVNGTNGVGVEAMGGHTGVYGYGEWMAGVRGRSMYGAGGRFESEYGHALVTEGPSLIQGPNPQQIALLRWYPAISTTHRFKVGEYPNAIAFDGANLWVVNQDDATVSVLRASDGTHVMTPTVAWTPLGIAFDGVNMWVTGFSDDVVSVLRASDGSPVMTPTVGDGPSGIAFDGTNLWVVNSTGRTVSVLRASDGAHVMTLTVGASPQAIAFDGMNMWVPNSGDGTVSVLRASDGAHVMTPTVGFWSTGIAFDGANMWLAHPNDDTVSVLRASDGAHVMTLTVTGDPESLAFDGANMWVVNGWDDSVSVLRASDGALVATVPVGTGANKIAFDGANMWVTNGGNDTVSKR